MSIVRIKFIIAVTVQAIIALAMIILVAYMSSIRVRWSRSLLFQGAIALVFILVIFLVLTRYLYLKAKGGDEFKANNYNVTVWLILIATSLLFLIEWYFQFTCNLTADWLTVNSEPYIYSFTKYANKIICDLILASLIVYYITMCIFLHIGNYFIKKNAVSNA
ncbi:MAG: hypothetical protein FWD32_02230 [Firmicutes bacterium]|nr:hypothetical protein [Bacillota bacterium]